MKSTGKPVGEFQTNTSDKIFNWRGDTDCQLVSAIETRHVRKELLMDRISKYQLV